MNLNLEEFLEICSVHVCVWKFKFIADLFKVLRITIILSLILVKFENNYFYRLITFRDNSFFYHFKSKKFLHKSTAMYLYIFSSNSLIKW